MYKYISLIFSLLILLSNSFFSDAQTRRSVDWDKVLDQYEEVCERCMELRADALEGKKVPIRKFNTLTEKLKNLRSVIVESGGKMSASQLERFQKIRSLYEMQVNLPSAPETAEEAAKAEIADKSIERQEQTKRQAPAPEVADKTDRTPIDRIYTELPHVAIEEDRLQIKDKGTEGIVVPEFNNSYTPLATEMESRPEWTIMLHSAVIPDFSAGASLHYRRENSSIGAFIKIRSNFKSFKTDYLCGSDGSTATGRIWTSGNEIKTRHCISAGASYSINHILSVYAGCGYGEFNTAWEDNVGKWAKVRDYSTSGLHSDAGMILHFNQLALSIGISSTAFRYSDLELGIGFCF